MLCILFLFIYFYTALKKIFRTGVVERPDQRQHPASTLIVTITYKISITLYSLRHDFSDVIKG